MGSKALDQTYQWGVQHPTKCLLGAHDAKGFWGDPRGTVTDLAFAGAGPSVRPWHCGWTGQGEAGPTREVSEDGLLPGDPYIVQLKCGKDWEVDFDFY